MSNSLGSSIDTLFGKVEEFVSTKTVVGDAITIGNVVLLPLIEVSVGVGAGVSNSNDKNEKNNGAGGMGAKITPSAVIVITGDNVQLINIKNQDAVNKLIDMAPGIASKLNFGAIFNKNTSGENDIKFEEETIVE